MLYRIRCFEIYVTVTDGFFMCKGSLCVPDGNVIQRFHQLANIQ